MAYTVSQRALYPSGNRMMFTGYLVVDGATGTASTGLNVVDYAEATPRGTGTDTNIGISYSGGVLSFEGMTAGVYSVMATGV